MEVIIPSHNMDFDFNSARSSPCVSVSSTPKPFGNYYFSAPTSPTRISEFYRHFDDFLNMNGNTKAVDRRSSSSDVPASNTEYEDDFAFDVSQELEKASLSADELFDGGVIRSVRPTTSLQKSPTRSPKSLGKRIVAAVETNYKRRPDHQRGRERSPEYSSSSSGRRGTRSLSPLRVSQYPWEEEEEEEEQQQQQVHHDTIPPTITSKPSVSTISSCAPSKGYRKWRLKDFFLFRSASEARASDKDPLRKYTAFFRKHEDVKNSSFRSINRSSFESGSSRRVRVSAHELHYTVNRAVSEDLKKKTFLPYKQGILGRLAFNPAVHALANGFGFSRK